MDEHVSAFPELLEPPAPYSEDDVHGFMGAWHAAFSSELNTLAAFEDPKVRRLFDNAASTMKLPLEATNGIAIYRKWNLANLAYVVGAIYIKLSITGAPGEEMYSEIGRSHRFDVANHEQIMCWLMDPTDCPTTWPTLLRIRRENPLYMAGKAAPVF